MENPRPKTDGRERTANAGSPGNSHARVSIFTPIFAWETDGVHSDEDLHDRTHRSAFITHHQSLNESQAMDRVVQLEGITKDYGPLRALDDVSLRIGSGVTGLLGPNGAGKTTLIKLLLGLARATRGTGQVMGIDLQTNPREIRSRVGYMPEDDCYIPGLSGVELVQFMARLSGHAATESLRRAHEILDYCHLQQERYRDVATYSTGMRQKLKFAQAIVHDPPLLILDEPTAGLDPDERTQMLARIRNLANRAGKAVFICTHILPDVQAICDDVVIMVRGRVRLHERLAVLNQPSSPAMQVRILGQVDHFAERIREAGYRVHSRPAGWMIIEGMPPADGQQVWNWAAELGIGIRTLEPARNSLEQIFLQAVQEAEGADP
jgi:ABC-2 type transport system ATP-binding protein